MLDTTYQQRKEAKEKLFNKITLTDCNRKWISYPIIIIYYQSYQRLSVWYIIYIVIKNVIFIIISFLQIFFTGFEISDVLSINDKDYSITFGLYFSVEWVEPRLNLSQDVWGGPEFTESLVPGNSTCFSTLKYSFNKAS